MVDLTHRWTKKELLDADDIPFDDIKVCMKELNSINSLLGGHMITLQGTAAFISSNSPALRICEIGCGGGDNLGAVAKKYGPQNVSLSFTGIDLKAACTGLAAQRYPGLNARWIANDYRNVHFDEKPDIVFSSLFCHHFSDDELISMLQWMRGNSNKGFFINDLQRSPVAYYLIKWLTAAFSRSYLVKNDACISVARGFRRKDWQKIFAAAGIQHYRIKWKWAFRYLIICKNA